MAGSYVPNATYRVQLHREFNFDDTRTIIEYLHRLGVSALYSSPILQAREGSRHGYDVVDPAKVNAELGGHDGLEALATELSKHNMGWLLDIVPNHMAISPANPAWMDVLAHGPASQYASWFDIAWDHDGTKSGGRIAVPVLGRPLDEAIDAGEINIVYKEAGFYVEYFDWLFPLEHGCWHLPLERTAALARLGTMATGGSRALDDLSQIASQIPRWNEATTGRLRQIRAGTVRNLEAALRKAIAAEPEMAHDLAEAAKAMPVRDVLDRQPYRLCHWKEAARKLTYRRFFDITHLIGVRVETPEVFHDTHELLLSLVEHGYVSGLRIDHIDGLADPDRYLHQLQRAISNRSGKHRPFHVLVEKILSGSEILSQEWPVAGTTGYDFLNVVSGTFVDRQGLDRLADYQASLVGDESDFESLISRQKRRLARELFGGEVNALASALETIVSAAGGKCAREELVEAIIVISSRVPVYRTYITREHVRQGRLRDDDRDLLIQVLQSARQHDSADNAILWFERVVMLEWEHTSADTTDAIADFIVKWQQFTGPLAAKGVEDTALYRDARLVSLNVVGADAERIEHPSGVAGFHKHNSHIATHWPHTMTTTSTHDTKRSEDVRSRIHVLSEMPEEWIAAADRWRGLNEPHRTIVDGEPAPDVISELFLYQTMLGAWPVDASEESEFVDRMEQYAIKAAREAKARTSWVEPNEEYEAAVARFVRSILDRQQSRKFLAEFQELHARIAVPGAMNSLGQVVLKIASPGVPDFYQGMELWDLSLVDPDNRRPVDFELRKSVLEEIASFPNEIDGTIASNLLSRWRDGRIKMFVTHRGLRLRDALREVFLDGRYIPLHAPGTWDRHICAFARRSDDATVIAIAPILTTHLVAGPNDAPIGEAVWTDATIQLPPDSPTHFRDAISGREVRTSGGAIRVADALAILPVALLATHP